MENHDSQRQRLQKKKKIGIEISWGKMDFRRDFDNIKMWPEMSKYFAQWTNLISFSFNFTTCLYSIFYILWLLWQIKPD